MRYDLAGEPGALRSRANPEAVRADGRELLSASGRISAALQSISEPTRLLRAPAGMFGQPPGLLGDALISYWQAQVPRLRVTTVRDTNHYSILFSPHSAACIAAALAAADEGLR